MKDKITVTRNNLRVTPERFTSLCWVLIRFIVMIIRVRVRVRDIVVIKKNLQLPHSHVATHCWRHTVQAQFDGFKQALNNIKPMSTAFSF